MMFQEVAQLFQSSTLFYCEYPFSSPAEFYDCLNLLNSLTDWQKISRIFSRVRSCQSKFCLVGPHTKRTCKPAARAFKKLLKKLLTTVPEQPFISSEKFNRRTTPYLKSGTPANGHQS